MLRLLGVFKTVSVLQAFSSPPFPLPAKIRAAHRLSNGGPDSGLSYTGAYSSLRPDRNRSAPGGQTGNASAALADEPIVKNMSAVQKFPDTAGRLSKEISLRKHVSRPIQTNPHFPARVSIASAAGDS